MKGEPYLNRKQFIENYGGVSQKAQELNNVMRKAKNLLDLGQLGLNYHFIFNKVDSDPEMTDEQVTRYAEQIEKIYREILKKAVL